MVQNAPGVVSDFSGILNQAELPNDLAQTVEDLKNELAKTRQKLESMEELRDELTKTNAKIDELEQKWYDSRSNYNKFTESNETNKLTKTNETTTKENEQEINNQRYLQGKNNAFQNRHYNGNIDAQTKENNKVKVVYEKTSKNVAKVNSINHEKENPNDIEDAKDTWFEVIRKRTNKEKIKNNLKETKSETDLNLNNDQRTSENKKNNVITYTRYITADEFGYLRNSIGKGWKVAFQRDEPTKRNARVNEFLTSSKAINKLREVNNYCINIEVHNFRLLITEEVPQKLLKDEITLYQHGLLHHKGLSDKSIPAPKEISKYLVERFPEMGNAATIQDKTKRSEFLNNKMKELDENHALPGSLIERKANFVNGVLMIKESDTRLARRKMTEKEKTSLFRCTPKLKEEILFGNDDNTLKIKELLDEYKTNKTILCDIEYNENDFWIQDNNDETPKRSNQFSPDLLWNLGEIDLLEIAKCKEELTNAINIADKDIRMLTIAFSINLGLLKEEITANKNNKEKWAECYIRNLAIMTFGPELGFEEKIMNDIFGLGERILNSTDTESFIHNKVSNLISYLKVKSSENKMKNKLGLTERTVNDYYNQIITEKLEICKNKYEKQEIISALAEQVETIVKENKKLATGGAIIKEAIKKSAIATIKNHRYCTIPPRPLIAENIDDQNKVNSILNLLSIKKTVEPDQNSEDKVVVIGDETNNQECISIRYPLRGRANNY